MAYTISYDGQNSGLQAGSIYGDVNTEFNISSERPEASLNQACMRDLRTTDPRDDKNRIEQVKGGLLKDSYRWIIDNESFKQWRYGQDSRLLWIRGDPGKGKTMLLCGIIDELTQSEAANVSFFFCQATDVRINSATAVLRGLIYSLVDKQPDLLSHVRRGYDQVGKQIFEDTNAWEALSKILIGILGDPSLPSTYLIIDALDECSTGLPLLLDFIIRNSCIFSSVKWIASSRNWPSIEEHLETVNQKTTIGLELNEASIAEAVEIYIQHRVRQLTELKQYNFEISQAVLQHLSQNSQRTFLWVALVSQELAKTSRWNTLAKLNTLPPGLTALYNRMLDHILNIEEARLCQNILAVILNVYRPITLDELIGFIDMPHGVSDDYKALLEIIALCGSFLTIRKHTISFIHQSAKEFLIEMAPVHLFKSRINEKHLLIFQLSLKVMFTNLRWNIYGVNSPGAPINQLRRPDPDPLAAARYQCLFWVDHVQEGASEASDDLEDGGLVDEFLQQKYLNWIEAISLLGDISEGIGVILKLDCLLKKMGTSSQSLSKRVHDCYRLIRYHRSAIESAPLQIYNSCLVFSPVQSINKVHYQHDRPQWVLNEPAIEEDWSPCLQIFEGHTNPVTSVAWSPDGSRLASGTRSGSSRVWDSSTGHSLCKLSLGKHRTSMGVTVWSPDGSQLASGSADRKITIWDSATGQCKSVLEGEYDHTVYSIDWSPCGCYIASGSDDQKMRIWNVFTGQCIATLEHWSGPVYSIDWSPDGKNIASSASIGVIGIWDPFTRDCTTIPGDNYRVFSIDWSPDGSHIALGSRDHTVRIIDRFTLQCVLVLEGHSKHVNSVAWSPDGRQLASGSHDKSVRIWDPATGQCMSALEGHGESVTSVAWSPDGSQLASGSDDESVRIWDPTVKQYVTTLNVHSDKVISVSWSPDGSQVASYSSDKTVKLWDLASGQCVSTFQGHSESVWSIAWSPDGKRLASGSIDYTVRIWDLVTKQCISIIRHGNIVSSIAWSPDGSHIASGSDDRKVKIWDMVDMQLTSILEGHGDWVRSISWSPDGRRLTSGSVGLVKVWDLVTGNCTSNLQGHRSSVNSIAWSSDGKRLATGSTDNTVRIWDLASEQCLSIFDIPSLGLLRVGKGNPCQLQTDIGVFDLEFHGPCLTPVDESTPLPRQVGYGLSRDRKWITFDGETTLWLPSEYRSAVSSLFVTPNTTAVAIGSLKGRVLFLNLSNDYPDNETSKIFDSNGNRPKRPSSR